MSWSNWFDGLVPSNPMWPFLAKKDTERLHSCTAFPVEFSASEKNVTNLHAMKIRIFF